MRLKVATAAAAVAAKVPYLAEVQAAKGVEREGKEKGEERESGERDDNKINSSAKLFN